MSSRYSDRQKHSREDYSRHSRSSYSSERNDDRMKRSRDRDRDRDRNRGRDRDRNYDRRSENRGHPGRGGDKGCYLSGDSRSYKGSKSRSKTDRTYNTDTEESDESCGSPTKITKRRLSSDCDEDLRGDRLQPKGIGQNKDGKSTHNKKYSSSKSNSPKRRLSPMSKDEEKDEGLNDVGPSLSPHLQKTKSKKNLAEHEKAESVGSDLPPSMRRKSNQLSGESRHEISDREVSKSVDKPLKGESPSESEKTRVGPVLPANLQKRSWPDLGEDQSESIGPALPPHIRRKVSTDVSDCESKPISPPSRLQKEASSDYSGDECQSIGPLLPPHLQRKSPQNLEPVGPALPPHKRKTRRESAVLPSHIRSKASRDCSDDENDRKSVGPVLPAHLRKKNSPDRSEDENECEAVGPVLPAHLQKKASSDHSEDENECKSIGPILPAHLQKKASPNHSEDECQSIGPVLPPHLERRTPSDGRDEDESNTIGPVLPPHLRGKRKHLQEESDDSEDDSESDSNCPEGPAVPSGIGRTSGVHQDPGVFGPALPPRITSSSSKVVGPSLPPGMELPSETEDRRSDESEDEIIGPMLPEQLIQSNKNLLIHAQLERRAAEVKRKMQEKDEGTDVSKREEWMLELPPEGTVDLGLGPRTFRMKGAPEKGADRSGWTDTPADKLRKQEQAIADAQNGGSNSRAAVCPPPELSIRDKEMEKVVKKHSKKRGKESLLDMHQKELNKKKKKEKEDGKKEERRPFSRELDLKTNVFDEAQKKSIFKKAQLLDTRFSRGDAKYL